jgi:DeoR family fructose operon transcriptional repressor
VWRDGGLPPAAVDGSAQIQRARHRPGGKGRDGSARVRGSCSMLCVLPLAHVWCSSLRAVSVDAIGRLDQIRAELDAEGHVRVAELADLLGVSEMTVRRDLDALAELGVAHRVRGGAVALGPKTFADRFTQAARAKDAIADKLLALVPDGSAIGLDASTTVQRLAARLGGVRSVTAITSSLESFAALGRHPGVTALLTGGALDPRTGSLVGPLAARAARDVVVDVLFTSAAGCDPVHGTTESTLEEADVKRALADVARVVVVAVDSTKLEHHGMAQCLELDRIDLLVTELPPKDRRLDPYRSHCEIR